jgi:hypothetical protein
MAETSSEPFHALASSLKASGFATHARRLEDVLNGTWTTSSELMAELGGVVLEIRRECLPLTPDQRRLARDCVRQVHRVWPGFGFLRGLWYRWF